MYNDWTPGELKAAPFLFAAVRTLKGNERVVLNGGTLGHLEIPYASMVHRNFRVMGQWMCSRSTLGRYLDKSRPGTIILNNHDHKYVQTVSA